MLSLCLDKDAHVVASEQKGTPTSPSRSVQACWAEQTLCELSRVVAAEVTLAMSCERMPKQAAAHRNPSDLRLPHPQTGTPYIPSISSDTLSAVGTTGGARMLGGDSGRFLCFCLRRSLSFRLWGRET